MNQSNIKPCAQSCPKCASDELALTYIPKDKSISVTGLDEEPVNLDCDTEYVKCLDYGRHSAKKEHIHYHCKRCHYAWRGDVAFCK